VISMKQELELQITQAIAKLYPEISQFTVELLRPENDQFGDYTSPIALALAGRLKTKPLDIAQAIAERIVDNEAVEKVEAIAPGFINITLKTSALLKALDPTHHQTINSSNHQTILFEYGCPNTHKIPHIGHLFSYVFGESASRLLEAIGHFVIRDNYQGDVGLHVAKCLWAFEREKPNHAALTIPEKVQLLQQCYQDGSLAYDEDPQAKQAIDHLNSLIYQGDSSIAATWEMTRSWSVEYYEQFEARLGINQKKHYFESQSNAIGKKVVLDNVGKIFEEDEGAVIFRAEKYGLHTRVFINQLGNPTYEAKDIGLVTLKLQDVPEFDLAIVTTANEQSEYYKVVMKASTLIYPDLANRMMHIGHGFVNLTTGKMSSRTGGVLTAISLVETVKERVFNYLRENRDYPADEMDRIAETVAQGAIKYSFLRSAATKNITFDIDSSVAFDGNSGPYLQYTYARCQSVLDKAGAIPSDHTQYNEQSLNSDEISVIRWLNRYGETVENAATTYSPHIVAGYLFELAQRYNYFYNQHQILSDDHATSQFRLALTQSVGRVLKDGLNLLGIDVLDKI
jgi:arginyl-tRNA synthetase